MGVGCGAEVVAEGLTVASGHDVGIRAEVGVVVAGVDGEKDLLACLMGELGHVAVFADEVFVAVGSEVAEGAVEGEGVDAWSSEPFGGDSFELVGLAGPVCGMVVGDLVDDPVE